MTAAETTHGPDENRHPMTGNHTSAETTASDRHGFEEHEYDVVVIGAGGAGLRAAIAAHDAGARVAIVCKSLLGKAHTVMAEGGIAAAMANVDRADDWRTHSGASLACSSAMRQLLRYCPPRMVSAK